MLGAIIVLPITLPSRAQPTGARARVPCLCPHSTGSDLPGAPSQSVCVGQSSSLPDSRCPTLHPLPGAGPVTRSVKRYKENGASSQRISREEAQRVGRGVANQQVILSEAHLLWRKDGMFHGQCGGGVYWGGVFRHLLYVPGTSSIFDTYDLTHTSQQPSQVCVIVCIWQMKKSERLRNSLGSKRRGSSLFVFYCMLPWLTLK